MREVNNETIVSHLSNLGASDVQLDEWGDGAFTLNNHKFSIETLSNGQGTNTTRIRNETLYNEWYGGLNRVGSKINLHRGFDPFEFEGKMMQVVEVGGIKTFAWVDPIPAIQWKNWQEFINAFPIETGAKTSVESIWTPRYNSAGGVYEPGTPVVITGFDGEYVTYFIEDEPGKEYRERLAGHTLSWDNMPDEPKNWLDFTTSN